MLQATFQRPAESAWDFKFGVASPSEGILRAVGSRLVSSSLIHLG